MSTNYYAEISSGERSDAYSVIHRYHIGKMGRGGIISLNGIVHSTWQDWKAFLGMDIVKIVDEYGVETDKSGFFAEVENTSEVDRARQYNFVKSNTTDKSYLDPEGYTMSPYNYS